MSNYWLEPLFKGKILTQLINKTLEKVYNRLPF